MVGTLTIHKATEEAFKKRCAELDIEIRCVKEGQDGDQWEVTFNFLSDIYALGGMVLLDSLSEYQNK